MKVAQSRHIDQWNRMEGPEMTHICKANLYHKRGKIHTIEKTVSSISHFGKTGQLHIKE